MENKINVDALLKQITDTIKDYIRIDWNVVGDLSNETGIAPDDIFKTIYTDKISIENVICLYNTIQRRIDLKTQEIIEKADKQEIEELLNYQLAEIKKIIGENPNNVGDLSNIAGILPDEILKIVYTDAQPTTSIVQLYQASQKVMKAKAQEIIERNILSKEGEDLITRQLEDVKMYVKPNPNIVSSLSYESGLAVDEIFKIVYTDAIIPITSLTQLHRAVEKLQEIKAEEIIERNR